MDKQTLKQYQSLASEIADLEAERERLKAGVIGAIKIDGLPHGSGTVDKVGDIAVKLAELKTLIDAKLTQLLTKRTEIEIAIDTLPENEQRLMKLRYIEGLTWQQIADELHYSRRRVLQIHKRIINRLRA